MPNISHPVDARLLHRELGQAALTATATLGSYSQRVAMRTSYVTQLLMEAIKVSGGNESYTVVVEVSNDAFTTVEVAAILSLGHTSVRIGGAPSNAAGDMRQFYWTTEVNGIVYKDWRIRVIMAGTSPSLTASAFTAPNNNF